MLPIIKNKLPQLHEAYEKVDIFQTDIFGELSKIAGNMLSHSLAKEQGFLCCYCMKKLSPRYDINNNEMKDSNGLSYLKVKVEHFAPRSIYNGKDNYSKSDGEIRKRKDLRINYNNLFAACEGCDEIERTEEEKKKGAKRKFKSKIKNTYCDTHKDNTELLILPNLSDSEEFYQIATKTIRYRGNGVISSSNKELNYELGGEKKIEAEMERNKDDFLYKRGVLNLNYESLRSARAKVWSIMERRISKELGTKHWIRDRESALEIARKYHEKYSELKKDETYFPFCRVVTCILEYRFKELRTQ